MKLSTRQYAKLLIELLETEKVSEMLAINFLKFLRKNRQERLLTRILTVAEELWKEKLGIVDVSARTAKPLSKEMTEALQKSLQESLQKNIELRTSEDPRMLGGVKLKIKDTVYNNTIRSRLDLLQLALTQ